MRIHDLLEKELEQFKVEAEEFISFLPGDERKKINIDVNDIAIYLAFTNKHSLIGQLESRFLILVRSGFFSGKLNSEDPNGNKHKRGFGKKLWTLFLDRCNSIVIEDIIDLPNLSATEKMALMDELELV